MPGANKRAGFQVHPCRHMLDDDELSSALDRIGDELVFNRML